MTIVIDKLQEKHILGLMTIIQVYPQRPYKFMIKFEL